MDLKEFKRLVLTSSHAINPAGELISLRAGIHGRVRKAVYNTKN